MGDMECGQFEVAGFTFSNNFDSGNLAHVQLASDHPDQEADLGSSGVSPRSGPASLSRPSTSTAQPRSAGTDSPDYEFHLWTRPDCQGTEYENGNRTWFYFGLRGGPPGAVIKFTVQNLNKQSKLFSQGMVPVFMIPGRTTWERLRDLPTFSTQENNFSMSFKFRNLEEPDSQVYFAFTYPYTYKELQTNLAKLEKKHSLVHLDYPGLQTLAKTGIYFHRELVIRSLEHRRLDLVTISGMNNIQQEKEPILTNLFPEQSPDNRPHKFSHKKIVFLSARVHPGETCSSHVMNGFIKFLLNPSDARAAALRSKYVFKLLPMLNPDGVYRGHYRTDTRGVNLNRVYSDPSLLLHPTIYAAKMLVILAHMGVDVSVDNMTVEPQEIIKNEDSFEFDKAVDLNEFSDVTEDSSSACPLNLTNLPPLALTEPEWYKPLSLWDLGRNTTNRGRTSTSSRVSNSSRTSHTSSMSGQGPPVQHISPVKGELALHWYEMTDTSRCSEGDESVADFSVPSFGIGALLGAGVVGTQPKQWDDSAFLPPDFPTSSSSSRRSSEARTTFSGAFKQQQVKPIEDTEKKIPVLDPILCSAPPVDPPTSPPPFSVSDIPMFKPHSGESSLFLYVDIHGHASKRGIFMYGNHFDELETKVSALLFPKLMSINSANFDFPACNFTAKNMFLKDRHTGAGKEGSGRVSVYKATGLTYCYTLECNFNTGRHTNSVPLSSRDCGRASPPPSYDHPPKYSPGIYEDCGRYMAISILDLTDSNPWTRLPCSSCKNVKGVRAWIRQYLKSAEAESAVKANKSSKSSPMRTRLRSLSSSTKKSPLKQLKLLKAPSSPEVSSGSSTTQARPLSKLPRKAISPKHSQSVPGKLSRQNSRVKSAKPVEGTKKKKRIGSGKKLKGTRPASKTGSRTGSKPSSRNGSRASSPRRSKLEPKVTKIGLQKKALQKAAWKTLDEQSPPDSSFSIKKVKRKKKRVVATVPS
eukprot:GFUD01028944.1.p1 GENE.GFUD01028944.1~~GFUD01028944.1.p1  ORF type:complete len:976 (+),score=255.73 GFUD01028944.1:228-3155(+)